MKAQVGGRGGNGEPSGPARRRPYLAAPLARVPGLWLANLVSATGTVAADMFP